MKKNIFCILIFIISLTSFAHQSSDWSGTNSGDYVIYRDYSWKEPAWIGFLYYNENTLGAFLYTERGKTFVKILFTGEDLDGKFILTGQNIISGINTDTNYTYAVNHLMDLLPKLYEWKTVPQNESIVLKKSSKFINEEQFGGSNEIIFYSYIPLFYIESILDKEKKAIFKLEEMGNFQNGDLFFDFTPFEMPKQKKTKFKLNLNAAKETKNVDGINLFLDSQWKQIAGNSFLMGNEAFLSVNTMDLKTLPEIDDKISFFVKYFCSSGENAKILINHTNITGNKKQFKIINHVYDKATKTIKCDIKKIIKNDDGIYTVISLTIDKSAYEKYNNYFDGLF